MGIKLSTLSERVQKQIAAMDAKPLTAKTHGPDYADEDAFCRECIQHGLPEPKPEYRFHETRKWRFDYAWTHARLALEVDGGIWVRGRHSGGAGQLKDMEKFNAAACQGWRVIKVTPQQIHKPETFAMIRKALEASK